MEKKLAGRNAIITGASRGLGRAIAAAMWREGANLLLVSRTPAEWNEPAEGEQTAGTLIADLADPEAQKQILSAARGRWSRLDILVNNAGMSGPLGHFWETESKPWQQTITVNL